MQMGAWIVYGLLFLGSLLAILIVVFSAGFHALDLSQFFGLLYLNAGAMLGSAFHAFPVWTFPAVLVATPPLMFLWSLVREQLDNQLERQMLSEELHRAEAFLVEHPEDPFPLEQMAELYTRTGDYALAAAFYERLVEQSGHDTVLEDKSRRQLKWMREAMDPSGGRRRRARTALCGCPFCGEINSRSARACVRCSRSLNPTGWARFVASCRELLGSDVATAAAVSGIGALPFRYLCGEAPFLVLWFIVSLALCVWWTYQARVENA
jgi:hypothetical protein